MTDTDDIATLFENAVEHHNCGRLIDALMLYDALIGLNPNIALVHSNRAAALNSLKRFDEALRSCDRAIELKPDYAEALNNRGSVLVALKRLNEALQSYDQAIEAKPNYAEAHYNRANALKDMKRLDEALHSYDHAIALKPDLAEAYGNRGNVLKDLNRWEEALASYGEAIALKPDIDFVFGALLYAKMRICDFSDFANKVEELLLRLKQGKGVCTPFQILAISGSPELQRQAAQIYIATHDPGCTILPVIQKYPAHEKIRLGYFSADYHDHATMHLIAELFEQHDRSRFELVAFSFGPDKDDEMRMRAVRAFDQFIDVRNLTDRDVALLSRTLEVDIAIDLKGFTQDDRTGIFSYRAAPIQINYLGYPGTMSADYIDYIIADPILIPEHSQRYYSEKIAYLPNSYQANDRSRSSSGRAFTRVELELPSAEFIFCCFNNNYKITPPVFDCWMRILKQFERSVLWLLEDNAKAASNLKKEAATRGINEERLIFAKRLPLGDHLARLRSADLFLDTLPYNAHTTASEALWIGLPVLTCTGDGFASRVAASLLNAIGLPELVTTTLESYEALAIKLASHPHQLATIRQKLASNRLVKPLFDIKLFTRHIEVAYTAMYERYRADLAPADIHVCA